MRALDARKLAKESKIDLTDIYTLVETEANLGNYSVNVCRKLSDTEIEELKSLGYKIMYHVSIDETALVKTKKPIYKLSWGE